MINLILFSNNHLSLPIIDFLTGRGCLKALISTDNSPSNLKFQEICSSKHIEFYKLGKQDLLDEGISIFNTLSPDAVIILGFSYRIPSGLFNFPTLGFFNIHYSLLPAYKGPDPIFWQLKNGETYGGISIHRVAEEFDSGALVMQKQVQLIPGETWGGSNSRFTGTLMHMLDYFIDALSQKISLPDIISSSANSSYYPRPATNDLTIDWEVQSAEEIERLINACNPNYGGAITSFRGRMVQILEVSPVDGNGNSGVIPGTVIHADASGLFVQCADTHYLRINILKLNEGIITGFKMAAMFAIKAGDVFKSSTHALSNTQMPIINTLIN